MQRRQPDDMARYASHGPGRIARKMLRNAVAWVYSCTNADLDRRQCRFGNLQFAEGDQISLDGNIGAIYPGALPVLHEQPERELAAVASWRTGSTTNPVKRE